MTIHWSVVNQTGATPLKESPSSRSYELPKTYQLKVGPHVPLPTPCLNTDWLDLVWVLCRQPQLLWAHRDTWEQSAHSWSWAENSDPRGLSHRGTAHPLPDSRTILGEEVGRLQELGVGEYLNKTALSRCGGPTPTCTILCSCWHFIIYLCWFELTIFNCNILDNMYIKCNLDNSINSE